MFSRLREWYIAAIGLLLIAGGLYFAAQQTNGSANNPEAKQTASATSAPEVAIKQVFALAGL